MAQPRSVQTSSPVGQMSRSGRSSSVQEPVTELHGCSITPPAALVCEVYVQAPVPDRFEYLYGIFERRARRLAHRVRSRHVVYRRRSIGAAWRRLRNGFSPCPPAHPPAAGRVRPSGSGDASRRSPRR